MSPFNQGPDDWGQHARRIQEQIKSQKINFDQREHELHIQQIDLHEEQEKHAHRVAKDQAQLDARNVRVKEGETQLAERMVAFEVETRRFEAEREAIARERGDLDRRKRALREEILAELHVERSELAEAQSALRKEVEQTNALRHTLQQRLDLLTVDNERKLKAERETLWQSLTDEWQQRGATFTREREEWAKACEAEKTGLERERAMFEAAMQSANAEFVASRETLMKELTELRDQHLSRLEAERLEWDQIRLREESLLLSRFESQQAEFLAEREALSQEFDALRAEHTARLDAERAEFLAERDRLRAEFDAACAEKLAQLDQERADFVAERDALTREFEVVRAQHAATCEAERAELLADRASVEDYRRTVEAELARQDESLQIELANTRQQFETELQLQRDQWEEIKSREQTELEAYRASSLESQEQLRLELIASREEHDAALAAERLEWELTRQREAAELAAEREQWDQIREQEQAQWEAQQTSWLATRDSVLAASREALEVEFMAQREQHAARLKAEREEFELYCQKDEAALKERQAEFARESKLIENRLRFQQDHLEKSDWNSNRHRTNIVVNVRSSSSDSRK